MSKNKVGDHFHWERIVNNIVKIQGNFHGIMWLKEGVKGKVVDFTSGLCL